MAQFECTTTIARPRDEVFENVVELENSRYFAPAVESVRRLTPGELGAGTRYEFREPIPPRGRVGLAYATYTAVEPGERAAFDFEVGALRGHGVFVFELVGPDTLVTLRGCLRPPRLMWVLAPVMAQQARRTWEERLRFIKDWIEAGAPREPTWRVGSLRRDGR